MIQELKTGLRLEYSSGHPAVTDLSDINQALTYFGTRIWPLDHRGAPKGVRQLLNQLTLNATESTQIQKHYLLSRERLLLIIEQAGRTPQVPGGGEISTLDWTHNMIYPQLYLVAPGVDYSRFDRFHVNTTSEGTGVDEVMQILSGGGVRLLQHLPDQELVTLHIDCVNADSGWIVTYDGAYPHIGSISGGQAGTKVLMQVIGPAKWEMKYEE